MKRLWVILFVVLIFSCEKEEAVRIVSLAQDGETEKADLYLLKAQKRYKP
jgi:hypothetical protein